jgi:beta-phosphoglucomutase-like phosphatase (HAD superfamily)
MVTHAKPDPEVFLKAAELIGERPQDCMIVEDARSGIDAGNAGGFATAGLSVASHYEKTKYKLSTISDLLKYI